MPAARCASRHQCGLLRSSPRPPAAAFPVRVGQGWLVTRTATYSDQLAEFRLLASSGALSSDTSKLDFVSPVWRFTAIGGDPARLASCRASCTALCASSRASCRSRRLSPIIDITNPPTDTNWLAANIKLADELRGLVAPLYFDGLRGIGLRTSCVRRRWRCVHVALRPHRRAAPPSRTRCCSRATRRRGARGCSSSAPRTARAR
jgi:hypothetical protein